MADFASTGRFVKISEHKYKYISDGANFTIEGENFDPNVVKVTNNVPIDGGFKIGMSGLNGNVIINGVATGVFGDDDYVMHGNIYPDSALVMAVIKIGDGATVKGTDGVVVENNKKSTIYIGKGSHRLGTLTQVQSMNFTVVNSKDNFTLRTIDDKFNFTLPENYAVTIKSGGNIGDQINFQTGGRGTISVGDTSLIINGDNNFNLKMNNGFIDRLENFSGACSIVSGGQVSDYFVETAIQHKEVTLTTDQNYSTTFLKNKLGVATKVYYTNANQGGVIDVSKEKFDGEILVAQGKASTIIGSNGNDNLIGRAADSYLIGGNGSDTFRGGAGFRKITVADFNDQEDILFHGSSFNEVSPLAIAKQIDNDFALTIGPVMTLIKNGADKKIKMIDSNGEKTFVGNYWQVNDFDPAKIQSTNNVKTLDGRYRNKTVEMIGNESDNVIISGRGQSTLTGGGGKDKFILIGEALITDRNDDDIIFDLRTKNESWNKVGKNEFEFYGFDPNDKNNLVNFKISGKKLVDVDNNGEPDGIKISSFVSLKNVGVGLEIENLSGEVELNGEPLGIKGDNNYNLHFTPIISENIPEGENAVTAAKNLPIGKEITKMNGSITNEAVSAKRFQKISSGAKISAKNAWIFLEGDGKYYFADGNYKVSTEPFKIGKVKLQNVKIDNGGKGVNIKVKNGIIEAINGLSIVDGATYDQFDEYFNEDYFNFDEFELINQSEIISTDQFDELTESVNDFIEETFIAEDN
ncbi:MAG: hypothetical protein IJ728_11640 [Selenomonadaceae bacterium]|nr:hypothetical protein [Selenomonadaceae bacterium]